MNPAPAVELVIVQHAQARREPGDPGLTDAGRQVADTTARFLARSPWDALYSSPLRRAFETAAVIGDACRLETTVDERLRERINWGSAPQPQDWEAFLAEWNRSSEHRDWVPTAGESSEATGARMLEAISDCVANAVGPRVLVVSHAGATVDLLRTLLGDEVVEAEAPGVIADGIPSCALTRLAFDRSWRAESIAQTAHLG